ncbi:MAG: CpaF family protein, partial [Nitrospinota bacterium]
MLRDRLRQPEGPASPDGRSQVARSEHVDKRFQELKSEIHSTLVENLDFASLESLATEEIRGEIHSALTQIVQTENVPLNQAERRTLIEEVLNEVLGYGPLETLL